MKKWLKIIKALGDAGEPVKLGYIKKITKSTYNVALIYLKKLEKEGFIEKKKIKKDGGARYKYELSLKGRIFYHHLHVFLVKIKEYATEDDL